MRKLVFKTMVLTAFTLLMLVVLCLFSANPLLSDKVNLITDSGGYANWGSGEVNAYLSIVREENQKNQLVIGDSVGAQLFTDALSEDYCVAANNQAMTMAGQYILVKEYLDSHPCATDVYLAITASTFGVDLNTSWGYQYVVMPHIKAGTIALLDENTIHEMEKQYGAFFMKKQVVELIEPSGLNRKIYLNALKLIRGEDEKKILSPLFEQYFLKIQELCEEREIVFHLVACPLKDIDENYELLENLQEACFESEIWQYVKEYFSHVDFYDKELFKDDMHFRDEYLTDDNRNSIVEGMRKKQHCPALGKSA